ncbi:MAG: NTP transferase domain-containing protein [Patescibacteria group bacterium]
MQALLLAAGRSRRFQPLGDKNFFRIGGQFLIEKAVASLQKAGAKKIVIVANTENEKGIAQLFPKAKVLVQQRLEDGMAGAVLTAPKFLTEPTLIASTNDLVEPSEIRKVLTARNCDGALLAQKVVEYFPGGYLKIAGGKIVDIVEKPAPKKVPSDLVNLVFHFFREPKLLVAELEKVSNKKDDGYELALAKLFKTGKFIAVENKKTWRAVKFPWHALDLISDFTSKLKNKVSPKSSIAKTAVVANSVISPGAKIFDFAIVRNSFVGRNAVVGSHSLVRDSQILENAVVGSSSEVARSSIEKNSWLHRNYVGDSIIAENVSLGSGAVCANLRLDEGEIFTEIENKKIGSGRNKFGAVIGENSRIGVNTSVMPGVSIGKNCFVGSGIVVAANLKSNQFLDALWKTKTRANKKSVEARAKFQK